MRRRSALALVPVAALGCLLGAWGLFDPPSRSRVRPARLARLTRGINTSHWFAQAELTSEHFRTYLGAEDVARIAELGFAHVRLSLDPLALVEAREPDRLNPAHLADLDAALDALLAADLGVIVDIHPDDNFKARLSTDTDFAGRVASFWSALASHLAGRDPERVFLEVMNEPLVSPAAHWGEIQNQLLEAMRANAPRHTLIATGYGWSSADELVALTPVADPNVVYNFHFYQPLTFTHQGATWGDPIWPHVKGVPYPPDPQAIETAVANLTDATARKYVEEYAQARWDTSRIEERILRAVTWARRHKVILTCNEFGVYRPVTPPTARTAWLRDVRTLLERYAIGWTMWDYAGGFGVVVERDHRRIADTDTLQALGLA